MIASARNGFGQVRYDPTGQVLQQRAVRFPSDVQHLD